MARKSFLAAFFLSQSASALFAVSGRTSASFLQIPVGAGPAAMGSAYSALAEDAYAPVWNPAGLSRLKNTQVAFQHLAYLETMNQEFLSFVHPLGAAGGIGAFLQYMGSDDITQTDVNGNSQGAYSVRFGAYSLSYGLPLGERLSLGAAAKLIEEMIMELNRLQALGVKAVTFEIPFPLFVPTFFQFNGDPADYQKILDLYKQLARDIRSRGLKMVVKNGTVFPGVYSAGSGLNIEVYYTLIDNAQFFAAKSQMVNTIIREIRPDYLILGSEPDVEFTITGKPLPNTVDGYVFYLNYILGQIAAEGLNGITLLGAGSGSWSAQGAAYIAAFCTQTSIDFIDIHVYPVNFAYLTNALTLANLAQANGKQVAMSETWLSKASDNDVLVTQAAFDARLFAQDAYSFWAPLDQKFLSALVKFAHHKKFLFLSPYWTKFFYAYLDYDQIQAINPKPSYGDMLNMASYAAAVAIFNNQYSDTGLAYKSLIAAAPSGNETLSAVRTFPNPWRGDRHRGLQVTFDHLSADSVVKLFTLSGHWGRTLTPAAGAASWDLKNDGGDNVPSGLYVYVITNNKGSSLRGKLTVIR